MNVNTPNLALVSATADFGRGTGGALDVTVDTVLSTAKSYSSVIVRAGRKLSFDASAIAPTLIVLGDCTVEAGGAISANGQSTVFPFVSGSPVIPPLGFGGGGAGDVDDYQHARASVVASTPWGIGVGGLNFPSGSCTGLGGGALLIACGGTLRNDGVISADGIAGADAALSNLNGDDGGAGGTVLVRLARPATGTGTITANGAVGGAGDGLGVAGATGANGTVLTYSDT